MPLLRRILLSKAGWNAAASYFSFLSVAIWGFMSIPVAVRYLDKEQIGIWAVVNLVLTYLVWLDLGVGNATGRLIAKSVADRDHAEINRWWTATRAVLYLQGLLVLIIGLALTPLVVGFIDPPEAYWKQTTELLAGGVIITAIFFPMRGIAGILTAQQRFHWIPLIGGITPWINFAIFFTLLAQGWGLRSYLIALLGSQILTRFLYGIVIRCGPDRLGWDRTGVSRDRFRALFSYSTKISVVGIVEAITKSLPTMIIARFGGLALVPVYNFASKSPLMGASLASRCYQSFYPALLHLHVKNEREAFEFIYRHIAIMTLGIGMIGGGLILIFNETIILMLAGRGFFPDHFSNIWFSVSLVTYPLGGLFLILNLISGDMGKIAWVYSGKLMLGVFGGYLAWTHFKLAGVAALFAFIPLVGGFYGYIHGARLCGTERMRKSCRTILCISILCGVVVFLSGYFSSFLDEPPIPVHILGRSSQLPAIGAVCLNLVPVIAGGLMTVSAFIKLAKGRPAGNAILTL